MKVKALNIKFEFQQDVSKLDLAFTISEYHKKVKI